MVAPSRSTGVQGEAAAMTHPATSSIRRGTAWQTSLLVGACASAIAVGVFGTRAALVSAAVLLGLPMLCLLSTHPRLLPLVLLGTAAIDNASIGIPAVAPLSLGRAVGAVCALAWALALVRGRVVLRAWRPFMGGLLFLLYAAVSSLWAADPRLSCAALERLAMVAAAYLLVVSTTHDRANLLFVVGRIWAVGPVSAALAMVASAARIGGLRGALTADGRLMGGMGDPNEMALYLVACLPFAVSAYLETSTRRGALLGVVATAACLVGLLATASRGGFVALVAVFLVIGALRRGRMSPRVRHAAALGVLCCMLFGGGLAARYAYAGSLSSALERIWRMEGRPSLWLTALRMLGDHPVVGVGLGNFISPNIFFAAQQAAHTPRVLPAPKVAHNSYLEIGAELGLVGLLLFAHMLLSSEAKLVERSNRLAKEGDWALSTALRNLATSLAGVAVGLVFLSEEYSKLVWLICALASAGLVCSAARDERRSGSSREAHAWRGIQ